MQCLGEGVCSLTYIYIYIYIYIYKYIYDIYTYYIYIYKAKLGIQDERREWDNKSALCFMT